MADKFDHIEGGRNHSDHLGILQLSNLIFCRYSDQFEQSNAKDGGLEGETTDSGETWLLVTHLSVKSHHRHV